MTLSDVKDIQMALDELGLALIRDTSEEYVWTLHQRKLYEQATQTLNKVRTELGDRTKQPEEHESSPKGTGQVQRQA